MGIIFAYKDPQKRKLQIIEIICLVIFVLLLAWRIPPVIEDYQKLQEAVAIHQAADALLHAGREAEALTGFENAVKAYPGLVAAHEEIAAIHYLSGRLEKTFEAYERGLASVPEDSEIRLLYSETLCVERQYQKALTVAKEAQQLGGEEPRTTMLIKRCERLIAHPELAPDKKHAENLRELMRHSKSSEQAHEHGEHGQAAEPAHEPQQQSLQAAASPTPQPGQGLINQ